MYIICAILKHNIKRMHELIKHNKLSIAISNVFLCTGVLILVSKLQDTILYDST